MQKNKPLLIGVIGGIGSGKSTVCRIFSTLGISIYNADNKAKYLMVNDEILISKIKNEFGEETYKSDNSLNRDYLAKTIFFNPNKLKTLNKLVHPTIINDFKSWISIQKSIYLIKEAALLIESGSYKHLDKLINVSAPFELRIQRIKKRDSFRTEEEIHKIMSNQFSEKNRNDKSDFIINNDETELLITQVLKLHDLFQREKIQKC